MKQLLFMLVVILFTACSTTQPIQDTPKTDTLTVTTVPERPLPYPVRASDSFDRAVFSGSRTMSGEPGSAYFTQWTEYEIHAELLPADTMLTATAEITYHNRSPYAFPGVVLELAQNLHAEGAVRNEFTEVTGGMNISRVSIDNSDIPVSDNLQMGQTGYAIQGTIMVISRSESLEPGDSVTFSIDFSFKIPQAGASERMGYSKDEVFHLAYWFPHIAVFDDVDGFFTDPFTGNAEFYHGFGNYTVHLTAPEEWVVMGTGELQNPDEVLSDQLLKRYNEGLISDEPVRVASSEESGTFTRSTESGTHTWIFRADSVRDAAFSATRNSNWDMARTPVGDRDNDDVIDHAVIHAFWRDSAPLWSEAANYAQHAISFLSDYTGIPYPWPHMTTVEAAGIIGGGMEFPMITIIGSYNGRQPQALYDVTAHELAHMWIPMIVSSNERRHAWMDEGATTFHESEARKDFNSEAYSREDEFAGYLRIAGSSFEGEIMRWSDFHYPGPAYGVASYPKPGSVLIALRGVLGEDVFNTAWKSFMKRWAYKHPTPYDMFNTFEDVSGRDLEWFWRSWYYETWTLDQAISSVDQTTEQLTVVIEDRGLIPMPVDLTITFQDDSKKQVRIPVDEWLSGKTEVTHRMMIDQPVTRIEIDSAFNYPDINRLNNSWQ